MMNWNLIINIMILAAISVQFVAAFLFTRAILRNFKEFIEPAAPGEASPLSEVADSLATRIAKCISQEVRATLAGFASGNARSEVADNRDAAEAALSVTNPIAGALLDQLPKKYKNKLFKNPALADIVISKIATTIGGGSPAGAGTIPSDNGHSPKFNL